MCHDSQENNKDNFKISLGDIKLATQNFSDNNCIGAGGFGKAYKGQVPHGNGHKFIVAKRLDRSIGQGEHEFLRELEILFEYKHENVIGLAIYCDEMDEKVIVYEYATRGSLDGYINDEGLTWLKRLEICVDVARGLDFLHGNSSVVEQDVVLHKDIKSGNILLNGDWKAKISDFGLSIICPMYQEMDYIIETAEGTLGYIDPLYLNKGVLTKESDIYSFGLVLFEILCGRFAFKQHEDDTYLSVWVKDKMDKGRAEEIVFEGIKEQIVPESLTTYCKIAYQCLHDEREKRPTTSEVMQQLQKALEFQEDYEVWEPKLPTDYKQIIQMSKSPEIYSNKMKKDIYDMFSKGILVQEGKVWFSLSNNGGRNEMISARNFSYKNRRSHKWRSVPESRFIPFFVYVCVCTHDGVIRFFTLTYWIANIRFCEFLIKDIHINHVWDPLPCWSGSAIGWASRSGLVGLPNWRLDTAGAKRGRERGRFKCKPFFHCEHKDESQPLIREIEAMTNFYYIICNMCRFKKLAEISDISNLKIQIKIRTQFLSPGVTYGVHLVFRFFGPRKSLANRMYVNLKFKKGEETFHAYFATWREDQWMMIELFRFYNHKENIDFEVLLESFSQSYCGNRAIYVEGVEFRAIDNASLKIPLIWFLFYILFVDALHRPHFHVVYYKFMTQAFSYIQVKHEEIEKSKEVQVLKSNTPSHFEGVAHELLRQQVFYIKRRIKGQILPPNTESVCYLVFKLSEKCLGLHCPVIVRDLHWKNKKVGTLYFRSPCPWNLHDTDSVPKKRKDGWMEVIVWKFNSDYDHKDDCLFVNLKLTSNEGTMAGLIVRNLEFRPI
ncbi:LOW QUALITY PROTEIN: hypothetical protein OSB04_010524 [Centaurea solstitialis]|uniref:Protein kinase domain-containing protein n=1 Tax=Centaurea solstitialis TaxID=347529 RepID=A0AA38TJJ1_9ASTR|nr:LOW QUALITY PROTEIN: hypothetical protein OSB04_010524 [Centaurea solstitialis]